MRGLFLTPTRKRDGFTIVELLIVIVIIAVLAAIITVSYNGVRSRAIESTIKSELVNYAKSLEAKKTLTGTDSYPSVISQFLTVNGSQSTVRYKYGDNKSFCLEATQNSQPTTIYRINSNDGIANVQSGACPTPASNATTSCVVGDVVVIVQQTNDTSEDVSMTNTSIYGSSGTSIWTPGQTGAVATTSHIPSVPAGFVTTIMRGINGSTYYSERYHAYSARTCS